MQLIFCTILLLYNLPLLFIKEEKLSLKEKKNTKSISERFLSQKGTHFLGTFIILISLISFDKTGTIRNTIVLKFGLNTTSFQFYQLFSGQFLHWNFIHLISNLSGLMLLMGYERRVGFQRYMSVFLIAGVFASMVDLLVYDEAISMGVSAGIAGLVSGFFLDEKGKSLKEVILGSTFVLFIISVYTFGNSEFLGDNITVNWISHFVGAISAACFIVLSNKWSSRVKNCSATDANSEITLKVGDE